jgi:tetratricopeptide (TPR) repeat protein
MNLKNQIELELYFADHFDTILFPVLAELYLNQNDLKRARKVCDIGLKHHQSDSAGLYILAQIEKLEGNFKETETALEQVLLFADDHLAAAKMLCEIQTVLGRAPNRLLKSWKHVLELDSANETAHAFIKKVELGDDKKPKKKILKPKTHTSGESVPKKIALPPEPNIVSKPLLDQRTEPLQVSSRLATFTLVAVLKNQGLFDQALEVLDALEEKGESPESISLERDIIETLIAKYQKD